MRKILRHLITGSHGSLAQGSSNFNSRSTYANCRLPVDAVGIAGKQEVPCRGALHNLPGVLSHASWATGESVMRKIMWAIMGVHRGYYSPGEILLRTHVASAGIF